MRPLGQAHCIAVTLGRGWSECCYSWISWIRHLGQFMSDCAMCIHLLLLLDICTCVHVYMGWQLCLLDIYQQAAAAGAVESG